MAHAEKCEKWDVFEVSLNGPSEGNPFRDVSLRAVFTHKNREVKVDGFYDGEGVYKVRFMPDMEGEWTYRTESDTEALAHKTGALECTPASGDNHGPVNVWNTYHFRYADHTPYLQVGTTCYVWNHQPPEREEQTLETLASSPFNKMRMCVFPKYYSYCQDEPVHHVFEKNDDGSLDFTRLNPLSFRHLEECILQLRRMGIEADIILLHPYDAPHWGYAHRDPQTYDWYLRYTVARLAAYRNVWWSMANEYDIMTNLTVDDWDRFFKIVQECDPYQRLRSIHNCREFYDHNKPWVTHQSIQKYEVQLASQWRAQCRKPVVIDECCYEGNVKHGWGNITAQTMVKQFWLGTVNGAYVGHGETYINPEEVLWWSKGGKLVGESPSRIAFLRTILQEIPQGHWAPNPMRRGRCCSVWDDYYLVYYGENQPAWDEFDLRDDRTYKVDVIDTWDMTLTPAGSFRGTFRVDLPSKPWMAIRMQWEKE